MTSDIGRKRSRLIQIICEEWITAQEYPGTLDSAVIYERLVSEGEHFAEGEMDALLTHLRDKEQIIHGPVLFFDREERAKHGAMSITGIAVGCVKTVRTSQPCIADQMLGAAAILGGKGKGTGLKFAHHIVANGRRCESAREHSRQLEARLLRKAPACG